MCGRGNNTYINHLSLEFRGTKYIRPTANPVVIPGRLCEGPNADPLENHPQDILDKKIFNQFGI